MGVERVDYYSDDEFHQAQQAEEAEAQAHAEAQALQAQAEQEQFNDEETWKHDLELETKQCITCGIGFTLKDYNNDYYEFDNVITCNNCPHQTKKDLEKQINIDKKEVDDLPEIPF